jgi:hypothetical protein
MFKLIPNWVWSGAIAVIAFAAGFVTNYYISYRANYLTALGANYEQFDTSTAEIRQSLKIFADIARGERAKTAQDVTDLQMRLLNAVSKAEDLSRRINTEASFIQSYETAAVNLQAASSEINGPKNGKGLVLAVNDYLGAEKGLRDAVLKEYNSFVWQ